MSDSVRAAGFAPSDPTDGRELLDWKTKYGDPEAKKAIFREACYLGILLLAVPMALTALWLGYPKNLLGISEEKYTPIVRYGMAWLSGTLGGVLFDLKWLYHTVARRLWHVDRRLWRVFTPHISGGLAFAMVAVISSGVVRLFDSKAFQSNTAVVGISFLIGYFSDSAIAKLSEIADTLFGVIQAKPKHLGPAGGAASSQAPTQVAAEYTE